MIAFEAIPAKPKDIEWLFSLHKKTLGPYVGQVYGWNDREQERMFNDRCLRQNDFIIQINHRKVGMISYVEEESCMKLLRIEIMPEHQRKGIGADVIQYIIGKSKSHHKRLELRVF